MWHWRSSRTPVVGAAILVFGLCSLLPSMYVLVTALGDVDGLSALLLDATAAAAALDHGRPRPRQHRGRRRRRSATRRDTGEDQPPGAGRDTRRPHCAGSAPAVHRGAGLDLPGRPQRLDERPAGRGNRARPGALSNPDVGDRGGLSPRGRAPRRGWPARRHAEPGSASHHAPPGRAADSGRIARGVRARDFRLRRSRTARRSGLYDRDLHGLRCPLRLSARHGPGAATPSLVRGDWLDWPRW